MSTLVIIYVVGTILVLLDNFIRNAIYNKKSYTLEQPSKSTSEDIDIEDMILYDSNNSEDVYDIGDIGF